LRKTRLERQKLQRTTRKEESPAEITIEIDLPSSKIADTIYISLLPETRQPRGFRSKTTVNPEGSILRLNIKAEDIVALRAASNAFLRFVSVAIKSLNIVAPFYSARDRDSDLEATGKIV
jgi:KEOPS complex subunit Pcc1